MVLTMKKSTSILLTVALAAFIFPFGRTGDSVSPTVKAERTAREVSLGTVATAAVEQGDWYVTVSKQVSSHSEVEAVSNSVIRQMVKKGYRPISTEVTAENGQHGLRSIIVTILFEQE